MVLVALDQQDRMLVAVWQLSDSRNLTLVIDVIRVNDLVIRSGKNESGQVIEGTVLPQEHVLDVTHAVCRRADGLSSGIAGAPVAAQITGHDTHIGDATVI
jgi:hypothetical protein